MLSLLVRGQEYFDNNKQEFVYPQSFTLELEHSLVSIAQWESKWEKSFLSTKEHSDEEIRDYIQCMVLTKNPPENFVNFLTKENYQEINAYIESKQTATWFSEVQRSPSREILTAEVIYYWMIALTIPFECQYWHLNRLLTLIRVCNIKNAPPKKMSKNDVAAQQRALNRQRRAQGHSRG